MENTNNTEQPNEINMVLAPVKFEILLNARRTFIHLENRPPELIVMHPDDSERFTDLNNVKINYSELQRFMYTYNVLIVRSFDVKQGKCCLY